MLLLLERAYFRTSLLFMGLSSLVGHCGPARWWLGCITFPPGFGNQKTFATLFISQSRQRHQEAEPPLPHGALAKVIDYVCVITKK